MSYNVDSFAEIVDSKAEVVVIDFGARRNQARVYYHFSLFLFSK